MEAVIIIRERAVVDSGSGQVLYGDAGVHMMNETIGYGDINLHPHGHTFVHEIVDQATIDEHSLRRLAGAAELSYVNGIDVGELSMADGAAPDNGTRLTGVEIDAIAARGLIFHQAIVEVAGGKLAENFVVAANVAAAQGQAAMVRLTQRVDDRGTADRVVVKIRIGKGTLGTVK